MTEVPFLDAQPMTVKYPAGNIAYTKADDIITFYNTQEKPVRIINLISSTDSNLLTKEISSLYSSVKDYSDKSRGCLIQITYSPIGLCIKEARFGCSSEWKDEVWEYSYNKYGVRESSNRKYDSYGNLTEIGGGTNYFTFNNVTLLLDDLGDITKNIYNKQHYLIRQLHYQNGKQRAASYIRYDEECRIHERFTYNFTMKCITNYQTFFYDEQPDILPALSLKYEPYTQEGVICAEKRKKNDTAEFTTKYRIPVANEPLAKMTVEDFQILSERIKSELIEDKHAYFSDRRLLFNLQKRIVEDQTVYKNNPESERKSVIEYDDKGRMIRGTIYNKAGKIIDDMMFKYNETFTR